MILLLATWLCAALSLYLTAMIVPSFTIKSFGSALFVVVVIGFLNMLIRPILLLLTLPINLLTLGLFTFVVNAIILKMASAFTSGLQIKGWLSAILGAVVLVFIQGFIFELFINQNGGLN